MAFGYWGIFIVPLSLWHRTSVFAVMTHLSSKGHWWPILTQIPKDITFQGSFQAHFLFRDLSRRWECWFHGSSQTFYAQKWSQSQFCLSQWVLGLLDSQVFYREVFFANLLYLTFILNYSRKRFIYKTCTQMRNLLLPAFVGLVETDPWHYTEWTADTPVLYQAGRTLHIQGQGPNYSPGIKWAPLT